MGSAVNKDDLDSNLKDYADAGFGGMHIIPIYGVKGEESHFIKFNSKEWYDVLDFTVETAKKYGLGIDITLGTGWPYGGPQIDSNLSAQHFGIINDKIISLSTRQQVKRAAPGGEGYVMDHMNPTAVQHYLNSFGDAFSKVNHGVRAFYNDSYEAYGANWTKDFLPEFKKRRGYNFESYKDVLIKPVLSSLEDSLAMIDYHETISDLLLDVFTKPTNDFAHRYAKVFRNEAHGAPGNILDLYAASDIPETEYFGTKSYDIPLVNKDPDYDSVRFGIPGFNAMKMASSPANLVGKKLVSCETATWLGNHFKVSLRQIKPIIDESFISGINHIFYHGIPYSPKSAKWPGWLFYASTNFNQQSHFYNHLPLLNKYVERSQYFLQNSEPDNDVLIYFPIYDEWAKTGSNDRLNSMDIHSMQRTGILSGALGRLCNELTAAGFSFDFISDRQLKELKVSHNLINAKTSHYKGLIIPDSRFMPFATLQAIDKLFRSGGKVYFEKNKPMHATGLTNKDQSSFDHIIGKMPTADQNLIQKLKLDNIIPESMTNEKLSFIRKKYKGGVLYFIANQHQTFNQGWIKLNRNVNSAIAYDPENHHFTNLEIQHGSSVYIDLPSGKSAFLFINCIPNRMQSFDDPVKYTLVNTINPNKPWKVTFHDGYPSNPTAFTMDSLVSWTQGPDSMSRYFSGDVIYTSTFSLPDSDFFKHYAIQLGDVRESAEVTINGKYIGTAWYSPYSLSIPQKLLSNQNKIEIKVTNLSANHIKYLDLQKREWRKFYDINMVDINYQPFDASQWDIQNSGLLGPIRISVMVDK